MSPSPLSGERVRAHGNGSEEVGKNLLKCVKILIIVITVSMNAWWVLLTINLWERERASWVSCARSAVSEMWFINQRWVSGGGAANYDDTSRRRCFPRWWLPHFYDAITPKRNECFETSGMEYLCLNGRKCLFAEQLEQWAISGGEFESKLLRNDSDQLAFNGNRLTEWRRRLLGVCGS